MSTSSSDQPKSQSRSQPQANKHPRHEEIEPLTPADEDILDAVWARIAATRGPHFASDDESDETDDETDDDE